MKIPKSLLFYVIVGGLATLVDWGVYLLLNAFFLWLYIPAVSVSFTLGSLTNFTLNKYLTFNNKYQQVVRQYILHFIISVLSLLITLLLMFALIQKMGINSINARIITTFIILLVNYSAHKNITFGWLK